MKFKTLSFCLLLASCANPRTDSTAEPVVIADSTANDNVQELARKEYLLSDLKPVIIDTSFIYNKHSYKINFKHYSLNDSGLVVPAMYNFDTREKFVTHNFQSELFLIDNNDTVFKREITKKTFKDFLHPELDSFATLLFPHLTIRKDTIEIGYSISIPVTDIGIPVSIKFDNKGNASTTSE